MFENIVVVAGKFRSTDFLVASLPKVSHLIQEQAEDRFLFLRRRIRRQGWWTVAGQVAFQATVVPFLKRTSQARIREIQEAYELSAIPSSQVVPSTQVDSVNQEETRQLLRSLQPDLVVVHGTRIISRQTLHCCDCPWVNIHAGLTPRYRGSHGGYWALYENRPELCGVTVHLVDPGIDTGDVLAQAVITPGKSDNFVTYPWLQLGEGIRLLSDCLHKWPSSFRGPGPSGLYYHPTLWQYLRGRARGVR